MSRGEHARAGTVVRPMQLPVLGSDQQLAQVTLCWSRSDPYAVGLWFPATGEPPGTGDVQWRVARELLAEGLQRPVGLGDVSVLPDLESARNVELILSSPDGAVGLRLPARLLRAFLRATWRHVPAGAEQQPDVHDDFASGGGSPDPG